MKAVEEANQTTGTASDWLEISYYIILYCIKNHHETIFCRFYSDNATKTNGGYRAAGYTISLRDTGEYGFLLPPDQVKAGISKALSILVN